MLNTKRVLKMIWSRQNGKSVKPDGGGPMPVKPRRHNLDTYDPYLVDIVKMLETLRNETKN